MPDAPVTVDVSTLAGPWPGITISGITGTGAAALNGNYRLAPIADGVWEYFHVSGNGSSVREFEDTTWRIELTGSDIQFEGEGVAPWAVVSWSIEGAATGTPALAKWVPPPLSADSATPMWPGFVITGADGAEAVNVNGDFALMPGLDEGYRYYQMVDGTSKVRQVTVNSWDVVNGEGFALCPAQAGTWPWLIDWNTSGGSVGGPLVFTYKQVGPVSVAVEGIDTASPATGTLVSTGTHNDILVQSNLPGRLGNASRARLVNPGTNNATLSVSVSGRDVTVNLATNGSAQPTSTANQVNNAMSLHEEASVLMAFTNAVGNNGSGICTAVGWLQLSGGVGGLPMPPVTVDL